MIQDLHQAKQNQSHKFWNLGSGLPHRPERRKRSSDDKNTGYDIRGRSVISKFINVDTSPVFFGQPWFRNRCAFEDADEECGNVIAEYQEGGNICNHTSGTKKTGVSSLEKAVVDYQDGEFGH